MQLPCLHPPLVAPEILQSLAILLVQVPHHAQPAPQLPSLPVKRMVKLLVNSVILIFSVSQCDTLINVSRRQEKSSVFPLCPIMTHSNVRSCYFFLPHVGR